MTDSIRASHILRNLDGRSIEDALKEIKDIKTAIDGGAEFADQAKENSDCPSSRSGGDLGDFGRGMMVAPFEEAFFALEVVDVSDPLETEFGFHLLLRSA